MGCDGFWAHAESKCEKHQPYWGKPITCTDKQREPYRIMKRALRWEVHQICITGEESVSEPEIIQGQLARPRRVKPDGFLKCAGSVRADYSGLGFMKTIPALRTPLFMFTSADLDAPSPPWIWKVWLSLSVFRAPSRLYHPACVPPPSPLPHLSPVFPFTSPLLPFLLVMRSIISQSFYTREATAWLLADVDKGWCCGCQAIQIISGIKRSIASFSKSSPFPGHCSSWVYFSLAE